MFRTLNLSKERTVDVGLVLLAHGGLEEEGRAHGHTPGQRDLLQPRGQHERTPEADVRERFRLI